MPALTTSVSDSFYNCFMKYGLTCLVPSQTTPAGFTYTSVILPPSGMPIPQVTVADEPTWPEVTAWSTSVILPPSGFPIPMVTVADEPSEATVTATATAAAAVTEDSTDTTTVIVETDEAWEAKLLEDMKVAVSHTLNGLDMVSANDHLVDEADPAQGEQEEVRQEEVRQEEVPSLRHDVGCLRWRGRTGWEGYWKEVSLSVRLLLSLLNLYLFYY